MKIVAVTSCPTGIAHTYMAAEALELAAHDAGHEIEVETQGAAGAAPLKPETIAAADAVIFAVDVEVRGRGRFEGKPIVTRSVKKAISDAPGMIADATAAAKAWTGPKPAGAPVLATKVESGAGVGTRLRQWLMTGVSYMIPFVAGGGILIALGFMFGGDEVVTKLYGGTWHGHTYESVAGSLPGGFASGQTWDTLIGQAGYAGLLFAIGKVAFFMLVPILAGFIAFAIADRPGLVPGVVGGLLAGSIGAGFLGGLVAGLAAGGVAYWLAHLKVPRALKSIMPVVVIPLVSSIAIGLLMVVVVGKPISSAQTHLTNWLNGLNGTNAVLLGILLGLMMAFDMGGPVNKVAYTFATAGLTAAGNATTGSEFKVMAAVMAAGMVPPLGLALATVVRRSLFTEAERDAGEAAWVLGLSFITEGAIPFAAGDPLRVIPSIMAGSAVTGGLTMAFDATLRAPHGGIWVIGLIGRPVLFLLAIAVGTVVTAAAVTALKSLRRPVAAAAELSPSIDAENTAVAV
jgi:PTS system fructose-specific IIC component